MASDGLFLKIIEGDVLDALKTLPDESVNLIVTSPPYWGLRDYGVEGQIGLEPTLDEYLDKMLKVTAELKRVLRKDGIMFWNHGDCYGGSRQGYGAKGVSKTGFQKPAGVDPRYAKEMPPNAKAKAKCMMLQNYRLAIRMIDEQGWILRNVIIWHKPNPMPSSVRDRFTNAYEPVFFFVKSKKYWSDLVAVREPLKESSLQRIKYPVNRFGGNPYSPLAKLAKGKLGGSKMVKANLNPLGKNPGDVWTIKKASFSARKLGIEDVDHFAVFPEELVRRIIKFGCPRWVCKKCGKPRTRIVKKNGTGIGWTDCGCGAGWRPGVVLDPFMGSGTTLKVARELGRSAIGIELNPGYVKIAKKRIGWGVGLDVEFVYEKV